MYFMKRFACQVENCKFECFCYIIRVANFNLHPTTPFYKAPWIILLYLDYTTAFAPIFSQ